MAVAPIEREREGEVVVVDSGVELDHDSETVYPPAGGAGLRRGARQLVGEIVDAHARFARAVGTPGRLQPVEEVHHDVEALAAQARELMTGDGGDRIDHEHHRHGHISSLAQVRESGAGVVNAGDQEEGKGRQEGSADGCIEREAHPRAGRHDLG